MHEWTYLCFAVPPHIKVETASAQKVPHWANYGGDDGSAWSETDDED